MNKEYHFGKYFSKEFYSEIKKKIAEFFEDISPLYNRNSLARQMKIDSKKDNIEKIVE